MHQEFAMNILQFREPVSTWSHAAGMLLSLPATLSLLHRSEGGGRAKRLSLLIYGLSMTICYQASALFHGVMGPQGRIAAFNLLDHIGIYLFIAGTYTSVAWNVLRDRWRSWTLTLAWAWAIAGSLLQLARGTLPPLFATGLYMGMGWAMVFIYFELARMLSHRALRPIVVGGLFYTVGAVLNVVGRPVLWPGVFESHELFHILVLAGSVAHYWFVLTVVVPLDPATLATVAAPSPREMFLQAEGSIFRFDASAVGELRPRSGSPRGGVRTENAGRAA
jgi:hemolysin III